MNRFEKSIDLSAPVGIACNQWTQFETFPLFMKEVKEVRQLAANHLRWREKTGGHELA